LGSRKRWRGRRRERPHQFPGIWGLVRFQRRLGRNFSFEGYVCLRSRRGGRWLRLCHACRLGLVVALQLRRGTISPFREFGLSRLRFECSRSRPERPIATWGQLGGEHPNRLRHALITVRIYVQLEL